MDLNSKERTLDDIIKKQEEEITSSPSRIVAKTQRVIQENILHIIDPDQYEVLLSQWLTETDLELFYSHVRATLFDAVRNTDKHTYLYNWSKIPPEMNKNTFLYLLEGLIGRKISVDSIIRKLNEDLQNINDTPVKENPQFIASTWSFDSFFSEEEREISIEQKEKLIKIINQIQNTILSKYIEL